MLKERIVRNKMEKLFKGTYGIVLTPFKDNGEVDYNLLEKYVSLVSESKHINGLVLCGSTGEFSRLSFDENIEIMKRTGSIIKSEDKQFVCGATAGDTYEAQKYIEKINEMEADGILLAPPYYFTLSEEEILAHYETILKFNNNKTPVVGYNIPQCTNPVSIRVFERLLDYECVKGYKNSWNDMQEITTEISIRNAKRPDVSMLTGLDACLYGTLALGGDGLFTAITYLMPRVMNYIYEMFYTDKERAFKCQCELIKLIDVVNRFTFPFGYRVLSEALGMPLGYGREAIPVFSGAKRAQEEMYIIYKNIISIIGGF